MDSTTMTTTDLATTSRAANRRGNRVPPGESHPVSAPPPPPSLPAHSPTMCHITDDPVVACCPRFGCHVSTALASTFSTATLTPPFGAQKTHPHPFENPPAPFQQPAPSRKLTPVIWTPHALSKNHWRCQIDNPPPFETLPSRSKPLPI